jgi:hypothetical protein
MSIASYVNFSGGITDLDVPGSTEYSRILDNVLIKPDGQVEQRPGFGLIGAGLGRLPSANVRIAELIAWNKDSELLAVASAAGYYVSAGAWTALTGPSSNALFPSNSASSIVQFAEWQGHIFGVSDSFDKPVKVFRDSSDVLRLRGAGLPTVPETLHPLDGGLADAILLANDLRTKAIAHTLDTSIGTVYPKAEAHITTAALAAQTVALNALVPATNLATLITLVNGLRTFFSAHVLDAQKEARIRDYHLVKGAPTAGDILPPSFLNFTLFDKTLTIPGTFTIAQVLPLLNDLRDKYNYHTYGLDTHMNAIGGTYTGVGANKTALPRVSTYTWAQITPNYSTLIDFVKDLKTEYNAHIASVKGHFNADTTNSIPSAWPLTPTTIQEAVILMGAIGYYFGYHYYDAVNYIGENAGGKTWWTFGGTATAASPTLTAVTPDPTVSPNIIANGVKIVPVVGFSSTFPTNWTKQAYFAADNFDPINPATVTGTTANTITFTANALASKATAGWLLTNSAFHYGYHSGQLFKFSDFRAILEAIDYGLDSVSSLQGISDAAKNLADYLRAHELDRMEEDTFQGKIFNSGNFYTRYRNDVLGTATFSDGALWGVHSDFYIASATDYELGSFFPSSGLKPETFLIAPVAASVNYTMLFSYLYHVGPTEFVDKGQPALPQNILTYESALNTDGGSSEQSKYGVAMANIYVHSNSTTDNWDLADTTNFKKEIYRTPANGTEYFLTTVDDLLGSITNAATTYTDNTNEEFIDLQEALYTNGGIVENEAPRPAKYIHILDNIAYYGWVKDGSDEYKNRILQSVPGDPDSVPFDFFIDIDDKELRGISSAKNNVVALGDRHIYRISGVFDLLGRGGMEREIISDETGCLSPKSVVQTDVGVFFAGKSGFFYTDSFQVLKISEHLDISYRDWVDTAAKAAMIVGKYDSINRRVYWTVATGTAPTAPSKVLVLHLDFGIKKQMCFTTWSGGFVGTNGYKPTAVSVLGPDFYVGTENGYVLKHTLGNYMDLRVEIGVSPDLWVKRTLYYKIKTTDYDYSAPFVRKYATRVNAVFKQYTNLSAQITNDVDRGRVSANCAAIRSRKLADWGDPNVETPTGFVAKLGDIIDERRHFASTTFRFSNMNLELKNAFVVVTSSDVIGNATVAGSTVTLNNLAKSWPLYVVDYQIELNGTLYTVTTRNSATVITVSGTPTAGSQAWELWGYPKNEFMQLVGMNVSFDLLGKTQKEYQGATLDGGENA